MAEKVLLTSRFLQRRMQEYEVLRGEIQMLQAEAVCSAGTDTSLHG